MPLAVYRNSSWSAAQALHGLNANSNSFICLSQQGSMQTVTNAQVCWLCFSSPFHEICAGPITCSHFITPNTDDNIGIEKQKQIQQEFLNNMLEYYPSTLV